MDAWTLFIYNIIYNIYSNIRFPVFGSRIIYAIAACIGVDVHPSICVHSVVDQFSVLMT